MSDDPVELPSPVDEDSKSTPTTETERGSQPDNAYVAIVKKLLTIRVIGWLVVTFVVVAAVLDLYSDIDSLTKKTDILAVQTHLDSFQTPRYSGEVASAGFFAQSGDVVITTSNPTTSTYAVDILGIQLEVTDYQEAKPLTFVQNPQVPYGSGRRLIFRTKIDGTDIGGTEWEFPDEEGETVFYHERTGLYPPERQLSLAAGESMAIRGSIEAIRPGNYTVRIRMSLLIGGDLEERELGTIKIKR